MNLDYSFKDYKNCWLYHKNSDERIIIKHIVYFDGSNEGKHKIEQVVQETVKESTPDY